MKKLVLLMALIMLFTTVFATGCASDKTSAPDVVQSEKPAAEPKEETSAAEESEVEASGGTFKIGVSANALSARPNRVVFECCIDAAKARGHEVTSTNANGTSTQQVADIENLISQGCDVIIIQNGETDALSNVVKEAADRGIHIISMETGYMEGVSAMFALNDFAVGAAIYPLLAAAINYQGEVITINHNDHPAVRSRRNVQEAVLKEYTNMENVVNITSGFPGTVEIVYSGVESALQAYPDVKAIFPSFGQEAEGALQACKALGREDILLVSIDGEVEVLKALKEGNQVLADVVADHASAAAEAIVVAEKLMAGESVNVYQEIPFIVVTKDNVDEVLAEIEADVNT